MSLFRQGGKLFIIFRQEINQSSDCAQNEVCFDQVMNLKVTEKCPRNNVEVKSSWRTLQEFGSYSPNRSLQPLYGPWHEKSEFEVTPWPSGDGEVDRGNLRWTTEAALSGFPLFQREPLCPAGWQDRLPHLCSWTTSIYPPTRTACRRSGGNISSTKKGSRPRKKAAYFLALSKRGVGFNLNPKKLCYII